MKMIKVFKIELLKAIANESEYTLMKQAKEIVTETKNYKSAFIEMKKHQVESLYSISKYSNLTNLPGSTVIQFLKKQEEKDTKEKTWAFKPESTKPSLSNKLRQVIETQKASAKSLVEELSETYENVLSGRNEIRDMLNFAYLQLVKNFIAHVVGWYYSINMEEM